MPSGRCRFSIDLNFITRNNILSFVGVVCCTISRSYSYLCDLLAFSYFLLKRGHVHYDIYVIYDLLIYASEIVSLIRSTRRTVSALRLFVENSREISISPARQRDNLRSSCSSFSSSLPPSPPLYHSHLLEFVETASTTAGQSRDPIFICELRKRIASRLNPELGETTEVKLK